ncbi:hypothetical protein JF535_13205 [Microbulbifer salipaludis]|uniref:DUF3168 domain-containing protein n=1 Tax=Microbulbifer salipaludis TaxID=187980 RepID=A0ABS3E921_9GAMM|nr:hypothetical protein [Microbulbifer salipaludis]MBN8431809.1 hypothetical protein [Microbulbifer salipaludis]
MIETGIVSRISSQVPDLTGNILPIDRQETEQVPVLVYQRVSTTRPMTANGSASLVQSRFQLNVYTTGYDAMLALRSQVRASLYGFVGDMGNGVHCYGAELENDQEEFVTELSLYGGSIDLTIWHEE